MYGKNKKILSKLSSVYFDKNISLKKWIKILNSHMRVRVLYKKYWGMVSRYIRVTCRIGNRVCVHIKWKRHTSRLYLYLSISLTRVLWGKQLNHKHQLPNRCQHLFLNHLYRHLTDLCTYNPIIIYIYFFRNSDNIYQYYYLYQKTITYVYSNNLKNVFNIAKFQFSFSVLNVFFSKIFK